MDLINKFLKKNKYIISLLYFPVIYFLGWIIISILIYPFPKLFLNKSLYGTIITFIIFLLLLPFWCKYKWRQNLFQLLGVIKLNKKNSLFLLVVEFVKALCVILSICLIALIAGYANFFVSISIPIILNSLFLGFLVGFAEELVFRVWLFEELKYYFKNKYANILQAIIFSLVHLRSDLNLMNNAQLLIGLFLLGLYLNRWRENKNSSILMPICFHASIVSLWFFITNSLLHIRPNIPKILFGPGEGIDINPVGGFLGIIILVILCLNKNSKDNNFLSKRILN